MERMKKRNESRKQGEGNERRKQKEGKEEIIEKNKL